MRSASTMLWAASWMAVTLSMGGCVTVASVPDAVVTCTVPAARPAARGAALVGEQYGLSMSAIPIDAVLFTDNAIANTVAVQALYAARTPTESVQVTARFVNCADHPVAVRARTSFLRANQAPSEPMSAWQTVIVRPRATGIYTENSIGRAEVASYLIEIAQER